MKVDRATVQNIARLARITVSDDEAARFEGELSGIIEWVEQLEEVDTDGVEPMTRVVEMAMARRDDQVNDGGIADDIVANAPEKTDHFFVVPKVVE
jgi:aspartyl-tRNA(Asn)/glutamyl-tRNA(Gln) amidotransferase subunit C